MKPRYKIGWITQAYEKIVFFICTVFLKDSLIKKNYFDLNYDDSLGNLPDLYPTKNDYYAIAGDNLRFEVIDTCVVEKKVMLKELATDREFELNIDLFDMFFIQTEKPIISKY